MARPQTVYEIAFNNTPDDPSPTPWTDITRYVRGHTIARGRGSELERFDAGTLTLTLDNRSRIFDPSYIGTVANLVTNPSFEVDTTGYVEENTFTPDSSGRVNDWAGFGSWSYKVEDTAFGAGGHYAGPRFEGVPATVGVNYSARVRVNVVTNPTAAQLRMDFKTSGGATISSVFSSNFTGTGIADMTVTNQAAPATTDHINVVAVIVNSGGAPAAGLAYFDGFQVTEGGLNPAYVDGDQPGGRWEGAAHASASYSGAPFYGNLKPLRRIRVRRLLAGVYTPVFDGYVEGWPQAFDGTDATVTVTAADGFMPLARFNLPQWPAYNAIIGIDDPIAYWRMGDTAPPVVHDERGSATATVPADKNTSDFGFPGSIVGDVDGRMRFTRTANDWVSLSELPDIWPRGTLEAWWEPLDTSDSNIVSLNNGVTHDIALYQSGQKAVFRVDPTGAAAVTVTGTTTLTVGTAYHIVGVFDAGGSIQVYVNGVSEDTDTLGGSAPTGLTFGDIAGPTVGGIGLSNGYIDEVAIYGTRLSTGQILTRYNGATDGVAGFTTELSGSRVGRLLGRVGNWAADSQVAAGTMTLEGTRFVGQTLRAEIERTELSEDGAFFVDREGQETFYERDWQAGQALVATFGNTLGALPLQRPVVSYDSSFLINSWNLTRPGSEDVTPFTDSASIAAYFERSQNVDTLLTSDGDVNDLGAILLARYKEPELRVTSFQVKPLTSAALTAAALAIELRARVGVSIVPYAGGAAIEQESFVERIVDTETPGDWTVEYGISPR